MSLKDFVDRKSEITGPGDISFAVRGLSLEDVVLLLDNHKPALVHVFGSKAGADFGELVKLFPDFIAAAVAYAADEPDMEDDVRKLPVGIQLKAIQEVWELSAMDVESLGKLATSLLQGVSKLNGSELAEMQAHLTSGSNLSPQGQSSSSPTDTGTETSSASPSGG